MKPILIKVDKNDISNITIEALQEMLDKAYEAGLQDGKSQAHYIIQQTPLDGEQWKWTCVDTTKPCNTYQNSSKIGGI